jgi:murein DD-endopeptidase MepM/ murein hydrolase activator NlpD
VSRVEANPKLTRAARPKSESDDSDTDEGGMRLYQSLYETALKQSIPKTVIDDLVRVFGNDVDFQRAVAAGDTFDAFYTDGDEDGHNDLLYASITVRDDVYRYYRFQAPDDGTVDFYDDNGRSTRKFLIRKPVPVGEMTSGFGLRFHPILGYNRPHTGVDWGAPIGTPILAAGSGTVLTAERNSSYGNHIEIQHANGYVTTYSHMSGFARGIVSGTRVHQGQVIGYLGQTGLATGPHLHYEVIVNGHFVDPMRVKLARTREMDGKMLASFKREHDRIDALMASAPNAVQDPGKRASN